MGTEGHRKGKTHPRSLGVCCWGVREYSRLHKK